MSSRLISISNCSFDIVDVIMKNLENFDLKLKKYDPKIKQIRKDIFLNKNN